MPKKLYKTAMCCAAICIAAATVSCSSNDEPENIDGYSYQLIKEHEVVIPKDGEAVHLTMLQLSYVVLATDRDLSPDVWRYWAIFKDYDIEKDEIAESDLFNPRFETISIPTENGNEIFFRQQLSYEWLNVELDKFDILLSAEPNLEGKDRSIYLIFWPLESFSGPIVDRWLHITQNGI